MIELLIYNADNVYTPEVVGDIRLDFAREGSPGRLSFSVFNDGLLNFTEGNKVTMVYEGVKVFYGYIFTKKRNKNGVIDITAYDQLRYLLNDDSYLYSSKSASELIKMIAGDFKLQIGDIEDTGFIIDGIMEENSRLFDTILSALDATFKAKGKLYMLFDDFGKLALKDVENMKAGIIIDAETAEDFDYMSTIDKDVFNKIKLVSTDKKTGKQTVYISKDDANIDAWGVLQYFQNIKDDAPGKALADNLLKVYNKKARFLTVKNAFGDPHVRAGSMIMVNLGLGDTAVSGFTLVESVSHVFGDNSHSMDLQLAM